MDARKSLKRVAVMALASVLAVAVVPTIAAEAGRPEPLANLVPKIVWESCGPDFPGAECAVASLPLDYDQPRGETTSIALAKIPASDPNGRLGTVFVNPGGPGGSGVELVLSGFGEYLAGNLGGRFDVVGFDPRGVGFSDPLRCFPSEEALNAFFADQPVFPFRPWQFRPFFDTYSSLGPTCLRAAPPVAAHMSTADVARDLDLLRQGVGDAKLTYLGFSYGSFLGTTYANLFPDRVRALVIDGVLNPKLWSTGRQIESDRVATQRVFDEFLRLCDEAGPACAFSAPGGSAARWEALADALRREPFVFPDGFEYSYDLLIADGAGAMYAPESWPFAADFFGFLAQAVLGDPAAVTAAADARVALRDLLSPPGLNADYPNGFDAYYGNHCADTEYPSNFGQFRATGQYASRGSQFGPYWWWSNSGCAAWPVNADRYTGPWSTTTSAPVLIVGNFFDGVTDYAGAQAVNRQLRTSRLLSYAGWGHTAYGRSACATAAIDTYLLDTTLPAKGTVCPANPNPFLGDPTARTAAPAILVGLPPSWLGR
jgi:pimeloyl-ACP methyl ester carboxylesterase